MMAYIASLLNGILSSKAVSIGGQIFQVGLLSTAWSFINNIIRTIQNNLFDVFVASIAKAA